MIDPKTLNNKQLLKDIEVLKQHLEAYAVQAVAMIDKIEDPKQREFFKSRYRLAVSGKLDVTQFMQEVKKAANA